MEKLIYDSSNGLWYELQEDYYIPCLSIPETQPIGKWGRMHLRYLQEHRRLLYSFFSEKAMYKFIIFKVYFEGMRAAVQRYCKRSHSEKERVFIVF